MPMQQKVKTFQEEHSKIFMAVLLGGVYPPGMEQLIKNKFVLKCFYLGSYIPSIASYIYVGSYVKYLILTPPENKVLLIQVTRRAIIILYMALQPTSHIWRLKRMEKFFHCWNYEINKDFCLEERKVILKDKLKDSHRILSRFIFARFWIAQLYNIPFMFNRYMRSSELAGMPHDNNSPYHFYYVAFQVLLFLLIGTGLAGLEFLFCYQMTMAEAEVQVLKEKLADIMSTIRLKDNNKVEVRQIYPKGSVVEGEFGGKEYQEGVKRVEKDLARWILAHQLANDWINDLIEYMQFIITLKYIYLGVHCSLVIIGLNGMTSKAMLNDLFLILVVTANQVAVCFNATQQADRIAEISETIFHDAYAESWYIYPVHNLDLLK